MLSNGFGLSEATVLSTAFVCMAFMMSLWSWLCGSVDRMLVRREVLKVLSVCFMERGGGGVLMR